MNFGNSCVPMTQISFLHPNEIATAFAIEQKAHAFPWSHSIFQTNQGERYLNLRLDVAGCMVAFAICQVVMDEASLFNLAVDPAFQRQGLGRLLLQDLIQKLVEKEISTLWLEVRQSNLPAIALYQSLEFNQVSVRRNYYPTTEGREDAILMALTL